MNRSILAFAAATACAASPLVAQEAGDTETTSEAYEGSVFDGDWISLGVGGFYSASYDGSDDYVVSPVPIVQGSLGGVGINPRPRGVALDFIPDADGKVALSAGVSGSVRRNRASRIKDTVVEQYGELDTAIEIGPTVGISFPALLNPYDSLSFNIDLLWDVAGAHEGRVVNSSVTYFTPLSRGTAIFLSLGTSNVDDDYADYYYSVPAMTGLALEDALPTFQAEGGFDKAGANLLMAYDLDGDVTNGGLSIIGMGGYSRMLGDGKRTPFTSVRGDADQWMAALGLGYTF